MLVPFPELLSEAAGRNAAIGAFTAYNLETAAAVIEAAAHRGSSVMLLLSEQAFASRSGPSLARMLVAMAQEAVVPCCVQLDHVSALETMQAAFQAGVGAVMADGSRLSYDDNAELVAAATRLAGRFGGAVEAELGRIEGDEEIASAAAAGRLTDPDAAEAFAQRTGIDCLAVSIGNSHGCYIHPPQLDLERLERIHAAMPLALSLHGASGLPDAQVISSVQLGIRKVNVNTELRDRYFDTVAKRLPELRAGARLLALQETVIDALTEVVAAKLALFASESNVPTAGQAKEN